MNFHLDEALLEPMARLWRFAQGLNHLPRDRALILADLGCGPEIRFFAYGQKKQLQIKQYLGIDPLISEAKKKQLEKQSQVKIVTQPLVKKINLPTQSVDAVTGFAFLEHIDHPQQILLDSIRILKPGGVLILTTPTPAAKSVLEFLAFKLGLISRREIAEHQNYFDRDKLMKMVGKHHPSIEIYHQYFEFGLNNLLVIKKNN